MAEIIVPSHSKNWIEKVREVFSRREPVALPTETVYGLAAPASDERAVARIYEIKKRPSFNPLIVHVKEDWNLDSYAEKNSLEAQLIEKFWPGPLSLLLKKKNISDLVTAGSDYVVLRAPQHDVFRKVLDALEEPLVAPSANSSTQLSPTSAHAVEHDLGSKLSLIVDGGSCEWGLESTIVKVSGDLIYILREGAITQEQLLAQGFKVAKREASEVAVGVTPGSQLGHYAPRIPLYLYRDSLEWLSLDDKETLYLQVLQSDCDFAQLDKPKPSHYLVLAPNNDLKTAAQNLFTFLKEAQGKYKAIRALSAPDRGLGRAINDRLLRASERTL